MGGRKIERAAAISVWIDAAQASIPRPACVSRQNATGQRLQEQTWQAPWTLMQRSAMPISSMDVSESTPDIDVLPVGSRHPNIVIPAIP